MKRKNKIYRLFPAGLMFAVMAALFFGGCNPLTTPNLNNNSETVTIILDASGGYFEDGENTVSIVKENGTVLTLGELAEPARDGGYTFSGWYTTAEGNTQYDFSQVVGRDITIYARWNWSFTVTFDANGGKINNADTRQVTVASPNKTVTANRFPSDPAKSNDVFIGWYIDKDLWEAPFTTETEVTGDMTVYARWNGGAISYTVTFNPNGGEFSGGSTAAKTATVTYPGDGKVPDSEWPADPEKTGSEFDGWYTGVEDGELVGKGAVITADTVLYARWGAYIQRYNVTFDAHIGAFDDGAKTRIVEVKTGHAVGETGALPVPVLKGFRVAGWYTGKSDSTSDGTENWGTELTTLTPVTEDITVYARWEWDNSLGISTVSYAVNGAGDAVAGTLSGGSYNETFAVPPVDANGAVLPGSPAVETIDTLKVSNGNRFNFGPQAGALLTKTDWTVEFYVLATGTGNNPNPLNFARLNNDKNYGGIWVENPNWYFIVRTGNSGSTRTQTALNSSSPAGSPVFAANRWFHIAYVKSGDNIDVYLNGELKEDGTTSFSMLASNNYFKSLFYNYFGANYLKFYQFKVHSSAIIPSAAGVTTVVNQLNQVETFTVTFNANDGTFISGGTTKTATVNSIGGAGGTVAAAEWPGLSDLTHATKNFDGWYTDATVGIKYEPSTVITGDITLYAHWIDEAVDALVTFDGNWGMWTGGAIIQVVPGKVGQTVEVPVNPARGGHTFQGWNTAAAGTGAPFTDSSPISDEAVTVYATWTVDATAAGNLTSISYEVDNGKFIGTLYNNAVSIGTIGSQFSADTSAGTVNGFNVVNFGAADNTVTLDPFSGAFIRSATDWTIELYYKVGDVGGTAKDVLVMYGPTGKNADGSLRIEKPNNSTNAWQFNLYEGTARRGTGMGTPALNTWCHIAIVRSGNDITTYLNGAQAATSTYGSVLSGRSAFDNINTVLAGNMRNSGLYKYVFTKAAKIAADLSGVAAVVAQLNAVGSGD
ncbi:MAG: InlB B-repeat-containing protein [Treponema sp.]|jgi:uncharacterized repeat protein (TIGR02543 family)|nr:InlB B-repeat-containing protein [Treponema sp.]